MTMEIRIKERVYRVSKETEEVYTPETIRELWSGDTADTCLVLALLERWERAESERDAARAECERMTAMYWQAMSEIETMRRVWNAAVVLSDLRVQQKALDDLNYDQLDGPIDDAMNAIDAALTTQTKERTRQSRTMRAALAKEQG